MFCPMYFCGADKMQAFNIDKGFMADDDLKSNIVEASNINETHETENDHDNIGEKIRMHETNFSVERLLAGDDKRNKVKEEEITDSDCEDKKKQSKDENLNICGFENLSNEEFQSSKLALFDNLEERLLVPENVVPVKAELESDTDETQTVKLKVTKDSMADERSHSRHANETLTVETHNPESANLKVHDSLNYSSDDSELRDTSDPKLAVGDINSKENLMRFAEVLYKCTLCTSIPSILTSKESFVKHITEQHLTHQQSFVDCPQCLLKFQTDEDLKEHKQLTHNTGSDTTENSELHDYTEGDVLSYDLDPVERDDSDSHSSGHRNSTFVFTQSHDNKNVSNVNFEKDVVKTVDGSIDLSLKNSHANKTLKPEKTKEKNTNQYLPLLHQITDQIVKSSVPSKNKFETQRPMAFTPSYTPEFGKYTKLVREGGNIVYFCQVCNWKSPVKATFSVHCGIADHKRKVIMAERSEKGNSCELDLSKISRTNESTSLKKSKDIIATSKSVLFSGEPVGWKPRGGASCLSLLSDPSGFFIGSKTGAVRNRSEVCLNKGLNDKPHSNHKRKKTLMNTLRHQIRLKPKWSDTDSEDSDGATDKSSSLKNGDAYKINLPVDPLKLSPKRPDKVDKSNDSHIHVDCDVTRVNQETNSAAIKKEIAETETDMGLSFHGNGKFGEPVEKKLKMSPHTETSVQNLIDKHVVENIKHGTETVFKLYKCHLCAFEYSDLREYGTHFEEAHKSLHSPDNLDIEVSGRKHNDRSNTGTPNMDGTSSEHWRVQKIKEYLPDYVKVNTKGNASRDMLLQRISSTSGIPDMVSWSSACNKAMREQFPSSLAQRKGKYKKTFYFGVSLTDEPSQEEEMTVASLVGDPDSLLYQPVRDLNADIEKLLEHLPTILLWTGDMDRGVYRDDILLVLADMLGDPETKNWGKQCNKAVRVVFPNVEIKRKGKDKTSVYFGLDFFNYANTQHFQPKIVGRPRNMDLDFSNNSSPASKSQNSPDTEKPLTLDSAWSSFSDYHKSEHTKGNYSERKASSVKDKYLSENSLRVEEYLTKFGGVSMFDSNEEEDENEDEEKCVDSDNDYVEMSATKEELES